MQPQAGFFMERRQAGKLYVPGPYTVPEVEGDAVNVRGKHVFSPAGQMKGEVFKLHRIVNGPENQGHIQFVQNRERTW
jgi:hypothetical protein